MRSLLAFLFLATLASCGGEDAQGAGPNAPAADRTPPPPEVLKLVVALEFSPSDPIGSALAGALSQSGFRVVTDSQIPHDVALRITTSQRPMGSGFFRVQVNGRERVKALVHVTVSVLGGGQMVDQVSGEMEMYEGDPPPDESITQLAVGFAKSPRLAAWAQARQAPPVASASPSGTSRARSPREDSDWYKLDVTACKVPPRLDSCDGVRAFLAKWPDGAHASEAQAALDQAQPTLEKLQKDENDWKAIRPDECRRTKTRDACEGVEVYLNKYPAGLHTDEAKRLLGK